MPLLSALSFFSTPSRGLPRQFETHPASFWLVWNSSDPLLFSFFSTSLLTMSHSTCLKAASRPSSIGWSFEDIKIGQLEERWSERRLVLLGSPLRDGQMDGWHVQTVASVSPLSWTQSCQKLCQTHVRQMGSVFIGLLFCEPPSTYSTFSPVTFYSSRLVPHCRCLGCYAFYLKMTINFTLLFFLLICIQVTLLFSFLPV